MTETCFSEDFDINLCSELDRHEPMQPMRLHWAPRLTEPRAVVIGHVCLFLLDTPCASEL